MRVLAVLCFLFTLSARAEELSTRDLESGTEFAASVTRGYIAPVARYSKVASQDALLAGGRGGWLLGRSWIVGLAAYGLATHEHLPGSQRERLSFGYGGAHLEYVLG